jgi:hypothetical protein
MKKILFILSFVSLLCTTAKANMLTVQNLLPYPVTLYFYGVNLSGTSFNSYPITFPPGPTPFANPTLLPGTLPYAEVTGRIISGFGFCSPYDLAIGSPNTGGVQPLQNVPAGNQCNNSVPFSIIWNEANVAPYNAVILIF